MWGSWVDCGLFCRVHGHWSDGTETRYDHFVLHSVAPAPEIPASNDIVEYKDGQQARQRRARGWPPPCRGAGGRRRPSGPGPCRGAVRGGVRWRGSRQLSQLSRPKNRANLAVTADGWFGHPVHLGDTVGAPVHGEHRGPYPRHRAPAKVPDGGEGEELLRVSAASAHPDQPNARRVVLDLGSTARVVRAPLVDHQDMPIAAGAHAGNLPGADDLGDIVEPDRAHQALKVQRAGARPGEHVNSAIGAGGSP